MTMDWAGKAAGNNVATFVWSRDNGSITFPIIELNGNLAVVQHLGRDSGHTLNPNDLVEVVDDRVERGHAGKLFLVDKVARLTRRAAGSRGVIIVPGAMPGARFAGRCSDVL